MMCLGVGLFGFSVFGAFCASCILNSVSFRFGKFTAIIYSNIFSIPFSFSSPSGIPIMHRLARFILSHRSHIAFILFDLVFCLLTWLGDFHYSVFHITDSFFCIIHSGFYWLPLAQFISLQMNVLVFLGSSLYFLVPFWGCLHYCSYLLLIPSVLSLSLLNSRSVKLQRSVSLLTSLGEFSCWFNWVW